MSFSREVYTVGWISALPVEKAAATAMLDSQHPDLLSVEGDHNAYTLGEIDRHFVVVTILPRGTVGTSAAAVVARDMSRSFPCLRFILMVGIGGGAPDPSEIDSDKAVFLGDVVVSRPNNMSSGVLQYNFGKAHDNGVFEPKGVLNKPPAELLAYVGELEAKHMGQGNAILNIISDVFESFPRLARTHARPDKSKDLLFEASYPHADDRNDCFRCCDQAFLVKRPSRHDLTPHIHHGIVASANQVMRSVSLREKFRRDHNVLCFEMEAAGLMDNSPCLVIRGISDYSDSHKNKLWQPYAALTAAAYAKELLCNIPPLDTRNKDTEPLIKVSGPRDDVWENSQQTFSTLNDNRLNTQATPDLKNHQSQVEANASANTTSPDPKTDNGTASWSESTFLHQAARSGNRVAVCSLLENGVDINVRDTEGRTPLLVACDASIAQLLLSRGADLRAADHDGKTLLHRASAKGEKRLVRLLLNQGADLEQCDESGRTPLFDVCNPKIIQILVKTGVHVNVLDKLCATPLLAAAMKGRDEVVKALLASDALLTQEHINLVETLSRSSELRRFVLRQHDELVRLLCDFGKLPNPRTSDQSNVLYAAVSSRYVSLVEHLLTGGIDVNIKFRGGTTALHVAATKGPKTMVEALLRHGASVNALTRNGTSALHRSAKTNEATLVQVLLEHGAVVDQAERYGRTPLHLAVERRHPRVVRILLANGANVECKDDEGHTALQIASRRGSESIAQMLLNSGASPARTVEDRP